MTPSAERTARSRDSRNTPAQHESPVARATGDVELKGIKGGVLEGALVGGDEIDEVLIAVGRRALDIVPLSPIGRASQRTFRFDLRSLPPEVLLEDRLLLEIRPKQQPTRLLATWEVESSQIYPFDQLPLGKGHLEGYVDAVGTDLVRGWVWDPTSSTRRVRLHLFVGDRFYGVFEASSSRPDLEASGRGDGRYGFSIPTSAVFKRMGAKTPQLTLVSVEPELWHLPLAPHLAPPRETAPLAKLGQISSTTRELVALLASSERLPKKIFAIERAAAMPSPYSADYLVLGLEFLRTEMVRSLEASPSTLRERLLIRFRRRLIQDQIGRLASLVEAGVASQKAVERAIGAGTAGGSAGRSHAEP